MITVNKSRNHGREHLAVHRTEQLVDVVCTTEVIYTYLLSNQITHDIKNSKLSLRGGCRWAGAVSRRARCAPLGKARKLRAPSVRRRQSTGEYVPLVTPSHGNFTRV